MARQAQRQVLIAGGGIGGLAAGLALARDGHAVRLYERAPEFAEVGAGIQLGPNVMRVLSSWQMDAALQDLVARPTHLDARNALNGRCAGTLRFDAAFGQRYGAPYVTIHRADLQAALLRALQAHTESRDVWLHTGRAVAHHEDLGEAVRLRLGDGAEVEGDLLVGADGLWSRVRAQCLGDGPPRLPGHLAYRAMVRQADLPVALRSTCVTAWLGPRLHVVQYPVRGGDWLNVVAIVQGQLPPGQNARLEDWDHSANAADLQGHLAGTCARLRDLIAAIAHWRLWVLCDRPPVAGPQDMARGRVALLGDAAHPMRPYLAQGAGMAIEDAAELTRCLAQADRADEVPTVLQRYALQRWARAARVQGQAVRNGGIYHLQGPMAWARDAALALMGERLMDQPWLYGGGPVGVTTPAAADAEGPH